MDYIRDRARRRYQSRRRERMPGYGDRWPAMTLWVWRRAWTTPTRRPQLHRVHNNKQAFYWKRRCRQSRTGSIRQREHLDEATGACWGTFSAEAIRPLSLPAERFGCTRHGALSRVAQSAQRRFQALAHARGRHSVRRMARPTPPVCMRHSVSTRADRKFWPLHPLRGDRYYIDQTLTDRLFAQGTDPQSPFGRML